MELCEPADTTSIQFRIAIAHFLIERAHFTIAMRDTTLVVLAMIAAMGMLGVIAVGIVNAPSAEAEGCINPNAPGGGSIAVNASKGRCVR